MNAQDVTDGLFRYFRAGRGYTYQLTNAYVFDWESDFFCIANSGYSYEVEVKVSRSDYIADFNKTKRHRILGWEGSIYTERRYQAPEISQAKLDRLSSDKYQYPPRSRVGFKPIYQVRPNKFCFACPEGLISPDEIPDYAGLIYVKDDKRYKPSFIKRPPALHKQKKDFTSILLKKYYWAYLNSLNRTDIGKNFDFPNEKETNDKEMVRTR